MPIRPPGNCSRTCWRKASIIRGWRDWEAVTAGFQSGDAQVKGRDVAVGDRHYHQSLIYVREGPCIRIYGLDITDLKRDEQALQRAGVELARSNEELRHFAYVASHDLQEPLRVVTGYLQLLERRYKDKLDADADKYIKFAVEGAAYMEQLINDLLAYSRVSSAAKPFQPTDMQAVLGKVLAILQHPIAESGAVITSEPLPTVTADETQMTQLLQNLIANAIKFRSERRPEIHVSARREGGRWTFAVRDNGIGIDKQYWDQIFVIFQRLHTRREIQGHRDRPGHLQEDRGAPRRPHLGGFDARRGQHFLFHHSGTGRLKWSIAEQGRPIEILLVEDSAADVGLTVEAFKDAKIHNRMSVVEDGVEAMAFLRREGSHARAPRPDLILLDLNLPRKDGRQVLKEIKAEPALRNIPVVVLTTSKGEEDVLRAYDLHANCYVKKPVDFNRFMDVVKSIESFWLTVVTLPAT